jgi:branched-chain amino acid transport system ATP-binding protein
MNPHERLEMIGHLRDLQNEGVSMLIIEHAMEVVRALCSEVVVMDHGEVIGQGEPGEVVERPEVVEAYLGK